MTVYLPISYLIGFASAVILFLSTWFCPWLFAFNYILFFFFFFIPGLGYELGSLSVLHSQIVSLIIGVVATTKLVKCTNFTEGFELLKKNKNIATYGIFICFITSLYASYHYFFWGNIPIDFLKSKWLALWPFFLIFIPTSAFNWKTITKSLMVVNVVIWMLTFPGALYYFLDTKGNSLWRFWDEHRVVDINNYIYTIHNDGIPHHFFLLDEGTTLMFSVLNIFLIFPLLKKFFEERSSRTWIVWVVWVALFVLINITQYYRNYIIFMLQTVGFIVLYISFGPHFSLKKIVPFTLLVLVCFFLTEGRSLVGFEGLGWKDAPLNDYRAGMFRSRFCGIAGEFKNDCYQDLERFSHGGTRLLRNTYTWFRLWNERPWTGRGFPLNTDRTQFPSRDVGFIHAGGSEMVSQMVFWGIPLGLFLETIYLFPLVMTFCSPAWKLAPYLGKIYLLGLTLTIVLCRIAGILGISTVHNTIVFMLFIFVLRRYFYSDRTLMPE